MQRLLTVIFLFAFVLSGCGTFEIYVDNTPVGESDVPARACHG